MLITTGAKPPRRRARSVRLRRDQLHEGGGGVERPERDDTEWRSDASLVNGVRHALTLGVVLHPEVILRSLQVVVGEVHRQDGGAFVGMEGHRETAIAVAGLVDGADLIHVLGLDVKHLALLSAAYAALIG